MYPPVDHPSRLDHYRALEVHRNAVFAQIRLAKQLVSRQTNLYLRDILDGWVERMEDKWSIEPPGLQDDTSQIALLSRIETLLQADDARKTT